MVLARNKNYMMAVQRGATFDLVPFKARHINHATEFNSMSKKEEGEMEAGKRLQTHADKAQFALLRNFKLKLFSH